MTVRQVTSHKYKDEIAEIAERRANRAKAGEQSYLSVYQGAVTEFMNSGLDEKQASELDRERAKWIDESFPVEVQRMKADKTGNIFLKNSAKSQYKEMGMRSVVWEFHENQVGQKLFQVLSLKKFLAKIYLTNFSSHDFNDSIGKIKVPSFVENLPKL